MRIEKLHIQNFGKIHDRTMELSPGLNVFFGKNESGKTTFYHFLKGMLYGLDRKRGRGAGKDEYSRYEPWEHPADYGGTLWFSEKETRYRLTRSFYKEAPSVTLLDTTHAQPRKPEELETLLGGVSEAVYENTVSVGQLKSVTGPDLTRELTNYMAACQGAADSRINVERAIQFLKMNRKGFVDQSERLRRQSDQEMEKLKAQMKLVERELQEAALKYRQAEHQAEEASLTEEGGTRRRRSQYEKKRALLAERKRRNRLGLAAGVVLGLPGLILMALNLLPGDNRLALSSTVSMIAGVVLFVLGLAAAAISVARLRQIRSYEERLALREARSREKETRQKSQEERLKWNAQSLREDLAEKQAALQNLRDEFEDLEETAALPLPEEEQIEAAELAMDRIRLTSGQIRRNLGVRLRERTSQILSEITEGKYAQVLVDSQLRISVNTQDRVVDLERLSRGTVEQIYFALRMASGELLCGDTSFPVILDDVFGMYDDERLCAVLGWLARQDRQVILFTCSGREAQLLKEMGEDFLSFDLSGEG